MSTLEKLFVQIFDRKNWIVDQLNQQKDLYDQYLASTLLINGIRPPSWLWNAGFEAGSSDLKELKKEDLISGLLFPPPRYNVPSSIGCNTFYNRSISAANNGQLSDHVFSETCASNKYFDAGETSTVVPKCHLNGPNHELGCTLNGVPEMDHTITSPQHQIDSRMSETCFEPVQSLARIQRSRSRQKALELRNSATEKSKKRPRKESCTTVYTGRITRSRTSSEQPCHVKELLEPDKASYIANEVGNRALHSKSATVEISSADKPLHLLQMFNCAERDDDLYNALDTQVTMERSSSGKKDLKLCKFVEVNTEQHPTKGDTTNQHSGVTVGSQTHQPEINSAEGLVRPDNSSKVLIGRVTRSRSASMNKFPQHANPFNLMNESDTQVLVHEESPVAGISETKLVSDAPVDCNSICSRSKQEGAGTGHNLEFLLSRRPSDGDTFVEPKQLMFDDVEDCRLNETVVLSLQKERQDQSPKMRLTSLESIESLTEVPTSSVLHEKGVDSVDERLLEKDQRMEMVSNKEKWRGSLAHEKGREQSVCDFCLTSAGKTSKLCSPLSRRGPSETSEGVLADREGLVADRSPESNKIAIQVSVEALKEVTMSNGIYENCSSFPDEYLLKKDHSMEVGDTEGKLKAYSGTHAEEKLEFVGMDKAECDLLVPISSTSKTSNLTALSSREGPFQTSDVVIDRSPERKTLSNQAPVESEKKKTISNYSHERFGSSSDVERLEKDGEEDRRMFPNASPDHERLESFEMEKIGCHIYPPSYTGRTSNVSPLSSREETPNVDEYVVADTSPESDKIIKQVSATSYHLNAQINSSGKKCTGEFYLEPTKILPEDSKLDINACYGPEESMTRLKKPDMLLQAQETGSCGFSTNSGKSSVLRQMVTQDISLINNAGQAPNLQTLGPTSHEKNVGCPKSNETSSTKISIQSAKTISNAWENSWPQCKRRKIKGQSGKGFVTSPRLRRVKPHQHEDDTCRNLKSAEAGLGTDLEFQHFPMSCDVEDFQSSVIESPVIEISQSTKRLTFDSLQYSAKLQTSEDELGRKLVNLDANVPLEFKQTNLESSLGCSGKNQEDSQNCLKDEVGLPDPTSFSLDVKRQPDLQGEQNLICLEGKLNPGCVGQMGSIERDMQEKKYNLGVQLFSHYENLDLIGADQTLPEFEGFSIGAATENILSCFSSDTISFNKLDLPSTTIERISVLEELCRSSSMCTPLPHPSKYKLHMDLSTWPSDNPTGAEINHYIPGRSHSDCLPSSSCQSDCDAWSPFTPPVGKLCQNIISVSAGQCSKKQESTNPELTPIHEDSTTSSSEENGNLSQVVNQFQEGKIEKNSSTCREPLCNITNINPPASFSEAEKVYERGSLVDSANADLNLHGSQTGAKKKPRDGYGTDRRYKNKDKENQGSSLGGNGIGKPIKSPQNRFSKLKSSRNTMEKNASQTFVDKGCKPTNIVSSLKSFLPCVQPKHPSAAMPTGRRPDPIKLKSLQAAKAAKLQQEKKNNENKMKKEALELERARLKEEKARELESKQKKKEEEAKKKAEMAAKKRLREEEDQKEKERKRMCKVQQKKLHAEKEEKELRYRTADEKEGTRKGFPDEEIKHQNSEKVMGRDECTKKRETQTRTTMKVSAGDTKKASDVHEDCEASKKSRDKGKIVRNLGKADEDDISVTGGTQEQSYDISPYKSSDDEEDEDLPTGKAFPSWSSEKCVAPLLCSLQQIDVYGIFPPSSFCSISEVLMPRKNSK